MQFLRNILLSIYKKPSLYLFVFIIIFSVDRNNRWFDYKNGNFPFVDDVDQFYSYLPAVFIQEDLTFKFPNNYWTVPGKDGNKIARTTYGMALMYSPFFFIGHAYAKVNDYPTNGYSLPYKMSLHFGTILYSLFGLWFCRKNLLKFFNEAVTCLTLLCIYLGTNLFYYTFGWGEMCHSYLFFLISVFIFYCFKWFESKKTRHLLIFSLLAGFVTLIRPTDIVILLFPLLFGIKTIKDLKKRIELLAGLKIRFLFAIAVFLFPIFIQLLYWKVFSGNWFLFTYGQKEQFFFSDPQITNFLFSFRKGWFVYTPIMFFILIGIPLLKKTAKDLYLLLIIFFLVNVYVLSSWWDWGFGGSFGCRAIIQHYAFFGFGLASFISMLFNLFNKNVVLNIAAKTVTCLTFGYLIFLNYNQSWKYKYHLIHYNGMTKEAYFYVFNKKQLTPFQEKEFDKMIKVPDFEGMLNGKRD